MNETERRNGKESDEQDKHGRRTDKGSEKQKTPAKMKASPVRNETSQQEASAVTGAVRGKEISEPTAGEVRNEASAPNKQTMGRATNDTTTTQQEKAGPTSVNAIEQHASNKDGGTIGN